jgi:phospholipid transport system substrate-binding protein
MPSRRSLLTVAAVSLVFGTRTAEAQSAQAASFIRDVGQKLVHIVDSDAGAQQKDAALQQVIDSDVDVSGIAKFCLGQYWRMATATQQQQYETLFRKVLMISIGARLGEYRGVRFTVGRTTARAEGDVVASTINAPNKAPAQVDWVVKTVGGNQKIVDVIAEGTSLRLTQRDDYGSFISQHNQSVQALIDALRKQVAQNA